MAARQDVVGWLKTSRVKPQIQPNTSEMPARGSPDGTLYTQNVVPTKHVLVDEGSYFITTNPTPQTVLAYGAAGSQAAFSDTVPFMQLVNTGNPGDPAAPVVFPDFLKIIQIGGTAPATTTSVGVVMKLDSGFRASTAGTPTTALPVCANMNLVTAAPAARLVYYTGAVATIPAASAAARIVSRAMLKGGPTLVLDEYTMLFGINDGVGCQGYLTTVASYSTRVPAMGIGPGQSLTFYLFLPGATTNPFSYEFELAHWER